MKNTKIILKENNFYSEINLIDCQSINGGDVGQWLGEAAGWLFGGLSNWVVANAPEVCDPGYYAPCSSGLL